MASDTQIVKSFLVALGWKNDETAQKKMLEGIQGVTSAVLKLGTVIEATALTVAVGVAKFAGNLEQLYFAASRVGSSADSLKAFDLAARNFGSSVEEAQASVEGLAAFMRENPGGQSLIEGWLARVGISARGVNGEMLQGTTLMARLGQMFAKERQEGIWYLAHQQAGMLGITDKTALAMSSPGFEAELAAQEKRAKGWERVAEAAHRFEMQLQNLKMQFYQMMLGFEGPAMGALQRIMTSFSRLLHDHGAQAIRDMTRAFEFLMAGLGRLLNWLDAHGDEIQKRITAIFAKFAEAYAIVKPALDFVYDAFVRLDKITGGWSTNLLAVLATLRLLGATSLVTGIAALGVGLAKALGGLAAAAVGVEGWAAAGTAFGAAAALGIAGAIGLGLGYALNKMFPKFFGKLGEKTVDFLDWSRDILDPKVQAKYDADPKNWYASHMPWDKPPAGTGASGSTFVVHNDIKVTGNADPSKVGAAIADATTERLRRVEVMVKREFLRVMQ